MKVVRLCTRQYPELTGIGSSLTGGRWNSKGRIAVYTSSCAALAVLEGLAHMSRFPRNLILLSIEIPDSFPAEEVVSLPANDRASRQVGDEWLAAGQTPILSVPSVLAPGQRNYLLNPAHPSFHLIKVTRTQPFALDSRLFGNLSKQLAS